MSFKSPTTYSISKKFAIFQGFTDAKLTKKFIAPEFNYKLKISNPNRPSFCRDKNQILTYLHVLWKMIHVWYVKKGLGNENKKDGRESGGNSRVSVKVRGP